MKPLAAFLAALMFLVSPSFSTAQTPTTTTATQQESTVIDMNRWTQPFQFFQTDNLDGWKFMHGPPAEGGPNPDTVWTVKDGVLRCSGEVLGYLRTSLAFRNAMFSCEWRWTAEPGNSGVLLYMNTPDKIWPNCVEGQLMNGSAGDVMLMGNVTSLDMNRPYPGKKAKQHLPTYSKDAENPAGEWNKFAARLIDDRLMIFVNGKMANVVTGCTVTSGHIGLQSEGAPIEFRNIRIEPLDTQPMAP
jgi:hypothetical protein